MQVMRTPRTVEIDITNRCNLRCQYCYHFSSEGDVAKDLPTAEWLAFFEELRRCAVMEVTLCGGEPFIRPDIQDLVSAIVRNNMRYSILSNGTLITPAQAAFLEKTHRCNYIQISLDGSCAAVHDSCRGRGSFDLAVRAIRTLQQHSLPVTIRLTIHHGNVHDLGRAASFILEELQVPSFSTNAASYLGLCRQHSDAVSLTVEDRELAMETLTALDARYKGRITAQAGPLADARMWSAMLRDHRNAGEGYLSSCGGCFNKIAVRADGVYVPCTLLPMIPLGRVNHDRLEDLWQHHPALEHLRRRRSIPLAAFDTCRDCPYIQSCRGGCPGISAASTGDPYQPSPDMCLRRFLDDGGRLHRE